MPRTIGPSPKVIAQLAAAAVTYVLAKFSIRLDPELAAAIAAVLGAVAGAIVGPGDVVIAPSTPDELRATAGGPQPAPPAVMPGTSNPPG